MKWLEPISCVNGSSVHFCTLAESHEALRAELDAARKLVAELAEKIKDLVRDEYDDCQECGHIIDAQTAPHSETCPVGALLSRARDCENKETK